MEVIDFKDYHFLKVCESPNIVISLNGTKQFCDLNKEDKHDLLNQAFGVSTFNEFTQVHGTSIFNLDLNTKEYDGYIERKQNVANAIRTADCIPLILWNERNKVIIGLHCGWRGIASGIIEKALQNDELDITHAYIGPHISKNHFEVKRDFIESFQEQGLNIDRFITVRNDKIYMDLRSLCEAKLHEKHIKIINKESYCSFAESDLFFSWRRDKNQFLRNLTIAWF
jgi:YfiH family protein